VGAGPLYGRLGRFFAKAALGLADCRSYRDTSSLKYLKGIGFARSTDRVYPDLAFSLPIHRLSPNGYRSAHKTTRLSRRVVGVGVMLYAGKYSVENPEDRTARNYLDSLVILIRWLLGRGYDVRLLIGDLGDEPVVAEFQNTLRKTLPEYDDKVILHDEITTVDELLAQIAETEFVIVTRFHNVLLALINEKPVVAISFHHKVASLMEAAGLSDYCLDINKLSDKDLISKVSQVEEKSTQLVSQIKECARACREALDDQYKHICEKVTG
jgi:polysaccharide pyruvyl transferase WcaK-like protein